jgi:hypothetical protein
MKIAYVFILLFLLACNKEPNHEAIYLNSQLDIEINEYIRACNELDYFIKHRATNEWQESFVELNKTNKEIDSIFDLFMNDSLAKIISKDSIHLKKVHIAFKRKIKNPFYNLLIDNLKNFGFKSQDYSLTQKVAKKHLYKTLHLIKDQIFQHPYTEPTLYTKNIKAIADKRNVYTEILFQSNHNEESSKNIIKDLSVTDNRNIPLEILKFERTDVLYKIKVRNDSLTSHININGLIFTEEFGYPSTEKSLKIRNIPIQKN